MSVSDSTRDQGRAAHGGCPVVGVGQGVRQHVSMAGHPAWVVTGHALVRRLMADTRMGNTHEDPASASWCFDSQIFGPPKPSTGQDLEDHLRFRKVLRRSFTAHRLEAWRPRVKEVVTELLDDVAASPQPVDMHATVTARLHALVWAEAVGVPAHERAQFEGWLADASVINDDQRLWGGVTAIVGYMRELILRKLDEPGDDVASDLAAAYREDPETIEFEWLCGAATALNFAGHMPTVSAMDDGIALLLDDEGQRSALAADPSLATRAVDEVLRYGVSTTAAGVEGAMGLPRWAQTDLEVEGERIAAGDLVMLDQWDANFDPDVYSEPERFDVTRARNPHVTFGYGSRLCVGAALARMEMEELYLGMVDRFPDMRLAVPFDELQPRHATITSGYAELPVRW